MKGTERLFEAILFAALTVFSGGCYTVISTVAYRGGASGIPIQSSSERISPPEQAAAETDSVAEPSENPEFGLKPKTYYQDTDREYTETEQDNDKTVVNNYYYYPDPYYDTWWNRPFYSRAWYDPWFWDGPFWPYRYSGLYIGFGYNSYPWYNPWIYGYDGYWVDPWCWYDPWYDYSWWHYPYSGWYAGGYDQYPWGRGHGGGGGSDVTNGPRKYRQDRLAGFGTSRDAGGVITVGDGSMKTTARERGVSERVIRSGARGGFGTTNTRRGNPEGVAGGTEKRASDSSAPNAEAPSRRNPAPDAAATHQRVQSGEMIRRYTAPEPVGVEVSSDALSRPVLQQGDEQNRMKESTHTVIRREASPEISGENAASGRSEDDSSTRARVLPRMWTILRRSENTPTVRSDQVQESPSPEKPAVRSATQEQASSKRSPSYTPPKEQTEQPKPSGTRESVSSRPSNSTPSGGGSRPSYSPPSGGGSRPSGSSGGGGQSQPSSSRSGSRRR